MPSHSTSARRLKLFPSALRRLAHPGNTVEHAFPFFSPQHIVQALAQSSTVVESRPHDIRQFQRILSTLLDCQEFPASDTLPLRTSFHLFKVAAPSSRFHRCCRQSSYSRICLFKRNY